MSKNSGDVCSGSFGTSCVRKAVAEIVFSEPLQGTSYHGSDTVKEFLPVGSKYLERTLEALWRT